MSGQEGQMDVWYSGRRAGGEDDGVTVLVELRKKDGALATRRPLSPRLDLRKHSPTGFEWGYEGSGPAQLALAILADALGDGLAVAFYQDFKAKVVAGLKHGAWELSAFQVRRFVAAADGFVGFGKPMDVDDFARYLGGEVKWLRRDGPRTIAAIGWSDGPRIQVIESFTLPPGTAVDLADPRWPS